MLWLTSSSQIVRVIQKTIKISVADGFEEGGITIQIQSHASPMQLLTQSAKPHR